MTKKLLIVGGIAALVIFLGLHIVWYIEPSDIKTTEELRAEINNGEPSVVELYSNY